MKKDSERNYILGQKTNVPNKEKTNKQQRRRKN